jgi:nucleotidyltransferase/DNA polymerase involved in DNA repair
MFAVLYVADFPLQAVLRMEPGLSGRPVALLDEGQRPPVINACTAEGLAHAVQIGSTASQAMARCPDIILRTRRAEAEAEARAGLLAAGFSLAPQVEDTAPGVCTIQVGGVVAGEREAAVRGAIRQLGQLGLVATGGLAPTPLLALYAARYGADASAAVQSSRFKVPGSRFKVPGSAGGPKGHAAGGRSTAGSEPRTIEAGSFPSAGAATPSARASNRRHEGVASPVEPRASAHEGGSVERAEAQTGNSEPGTAKRVRTKPAPSSSAPGTLNPELGTVREEPGTLNLEPGTGDEDPLAVGCSDERGAVFALLTSTQVRTFLRDLPLGVAEPAPEIGPILAGWGIRTLGQLTALTKADVTQRLGPAGLALWERAAGEVDRPLRLVNPPQAFEAALDLESAVETLEPVLFLLRRFIDRLALELGNAGYVAGELRLELKLADETRHQREFRLPEPTAREEILFRVLHTHLETLHTAAEVCGVRLACRPVRPLNRQQGLFESALRDPHGFAETLARVAAVVGPDRIGTPVLENTHRPDAVRLESPRPVVPPPPASAPPQYGPPLRRWRPALPAKVELQQHTPVFVWTAHAAGTVRALAGPWRGSGDWWDPAHRWQREEWDVALDSGGLYRLLHTPDGWFLEGEYD